MSLIKSHIGLRQKCDENFVLNSIGDNVKLVNKQSSLFKSRVTTIVVSLMQPPVVPKK